MLAVHVPGILYAVERRNSPQNIGLTIVGYLYRQGIEKRAMGYACAVRSGIAVCGYDY